LPLRDDELEEDDDEVLFTRVTVLPLIVVLPLNLLLLPLPLLVALITVLPT
jgi:hypothetical protein